LGNQAEIQIAADIVQARAALAHAGDNAFFDFVADGRTSGVKGEIVHICPSQQNDAPHPKFQWTWERQNISATAKKTMYWDCLFVANAFVNDDYPSPTAVPSMKELAVDIADARRLLHSDCGHCKNTDCSGRDIDCGHQTALDKFFCEANKKQTMWKCEGKKFVCTSSCQ
jgi:hypothetical protein